MTQMTDVMSPLTAQHDQFTVAAGDAPSWLQALRKRGLEHFEKVGLPTTRDEEWQQTNVAVLGRSEFRLSDGEPAGRTEAQLEPFAIPDLDVHRLVFVDGVYDPGLTQVAGLPDGVIVSTLRQAIESNADAVEPHLGAHAAPDSEPFVALNSAYLSDGLFVRVADGVKLDRPIHVLFVSSPGAADTAVHPRVLIVAGDAAAVDVIEQHAAVSESTRYFSNAVTEVVAGDRANVSHYFLELESDEAINVSTLQVKQGVESDFRSHSVLLGGKIVRNNINPTLAGENGFSVLNGLYVPTDGRHMDNHMYVHHTHPDCESRQYYTGVLRDGGSGAFIGRIKVERPAQKTDAVQSSRNLMLTDDCHAHNRPQLEIFADDVKCTHGSTTGELDEQSIFYLRSRGLPEAVARGLLVYSFAEESLERMALEPVRRWLATKLIAGLGLDPAVARVLE